MTRFGPKRRVSMLLNGIASVRPAMYPLLTRASAEGVALRACAIAGKATLAINMLIKSRKAQQIDSGDFAAIRHGGTSREVAYRIDPGSTDKRQSAIYCQKF